MLGFTVVTERNAITVLREHTYRPRKHLGNCFWLWKTVRYRKFTLNLFVVNAFPKYSFKSLITKSASGLLSCDMNNEHTNYPRLFSFISKNIDRGRNSSCYIALCAKSVGNFTTVTDRQLFGFGNL